MIRSARITSVVIIILGLLTAGFVYVTEREDAPERFAFKLGLDLSGGTQLVYDADTSVVPPEDVDTSMDALREVVERRVDLFGVAEPRVHTERGGLGGEEHRLIVELPGVTDIEEAVERIGKTPLLEFRLQMPQGEEAANAVNVGEDGAVELTIDTLFQETGLTGALVERARVQFDPTTGQPTVAINFNREGSELMATITTEHVGEVLAIFLDGEPISLPVIQTPITDGTAIISGGFTLDEARELARDLNLGALPIPIELVSTSSVGPTLGAGVVEDGLRAAIVGFFLVVIFLVAAYRLPGLVASIALLFYVAVMLSLFKLIPVTLTASGIIGFVLSVGLAVDAKIIIYERIKEELALRKSIFEAVRDGFARAWIPIRDANATSLIASIALFYFGPSVIQGFALVFGLGILVSLLSSMVVLRAFLFALSTERESPLLRKLFISSGMSAPDKKII
jgi:protein-export membrane protein SecD